MNVEETGSICWYCRDPATHSAADKYPPACDACVGWRSIPPPPSDYVPGTYYPAVPKPYACGHCGKPTSSVGYRGEDGRLRPATCIRFACQQANDDLTDLINTTKPASA